MQQKRVKELNITINGTNIKRVQSFNFLGITLSESMSWANHLLFIKKKISKVINHALSSNCIDLKLVALDSH